MQTKLIVIFLLVKVIPLILLTLIAWRQFALLGDVLRDIAVNDSANSLNDRAIKNIERLTTDTARRVAEFLYECDDNIRYAARLTPGQESYSAFVNGIRRRVVKPGPRELSPDGKSWIGAEPPPPEAAASSNPENNDMDGFNTFPRDNFAYDNLPVYDEITFIDPSGRELFKAVASDSPKRHYPLDPDRKDVSRRENTYVRAETYFAELKKLRPGEIYVSDVIGAYVGSNYIGMYTPGNLAAASQTRGYEIAYKPEEQAYSGAENPRGRRFEGIVRWGTPVAGADGEIAGYVTLALNHDHLMEFVDHITPMDERYTELPSAYEGNYAFIWDYKCRSVCHPRHHSIVGFNPETGDPEVPWLEESIFAGWRRSGLAKWTDYVKDHPVFHEQSRAKKPAAELTRDGLVGLDGRYLNNAPQCTGWMDLTGDGGSGSFYILWSGLYKLTTAAAIPYYTGPYAPSAANGYSRRGFGFVAIGSGLEHFSRPARETEAKLGLSISENMEATFEQLTLTTVVLCLAVILIAVLMAWNISRPIKDMAGQMSRLAVGDIATVEGSMSSSDQRRYDEIGLLARSLHGLTLSRREEIEMVNTIARGDYTRSIRLKSGMDLLGKALNAMIRINKQTLFQVNQAVKRVGQGAEDVSNVSISLSQGVETSEAELKKISSTVETVDHQAQENATHARGANQLAVTSRDAANRGYDSVIKLTAAMAEIQQSGKKIASVAKLIDDIAFQTNLLALNAAVEASRAGRHGKGFSVVADEVRSLSARSAKAAHETGEMVESMLKLMESGTRLALHSDQEFQEIVKTTAQVAQLFASIADASLAQSSSMSEIVQSLGQIDLVTRDNSKNARQIASSAGDLSGQAEDLRRLVSYYRLGAESPAEGREGEQNGRLARLPGGGDDSLRR
jgi:methyl-accepting chemotaxis protein